MQRQEGRQVKREAFTHPKLFDFACRLELSRVEAIGYLTLLIDWASDYAPQGDVGKWPNRVIAMACDWQSDADAFIEALVGAGWLDENDDHRLIIHDWPEHAQVWVRAKLAKSGKAFLACYSTPVGSPEASVVASTEASPEANTNVSITKLSKPKPNLTSKPPAADSPEVPEAIAGDEMLAAAVEDWLSYKAERRERFKPRGLKAFYSEVANAAARHGPVEVVRAIQTAMANNWQGWTHGLGQESRAGPRGGGRRHTEITPL